MSYREIRKALGCSKSTISYHCGKNNSEKKRVKNQRGTAEYNLSKKINNFKSKCTKAQWRAFRSKIKGFKKKRSAKDRKPSTTWRVHNISKPYTVKDVVKKIGANPKCYLTGREIDLNDTSSYTLDLRIPTILGGTNDLENLEVCCAEANHAKAGLLLDDFYALCEEILAWRDKSKKT